MAKIRVVGLNPAWQQVFSLPPASPHAAPGSITRAPGFETIAGGKGLNAAKLLARLGHDVSVVQILAGLNGRRCLEACEAWGIESLHVWAAGETRVCATLLSGGEAAEIIGPFSADHPDLPAELLGVLPSEPVDAVLFCGAPPRGLPETFYADILDRTDAPRVFWDSVAGLDHARGPAVAARIDWLKVNALEYAALAPRFEKTGAKVLITDGPNAASVRNGQAAGRYALPRVEGVVNPIGAGDTVLAALVDGILQEVDETAAVRRALAAGMASCLNPLPAEWSAADAARLEKDIRWEPA